MTKVEVFEKAVRDFGVKAALEYFNTPTELRFLWESEIKKEMEEKGIESPVQQPTDQQFHPEAGRH